MATKPEKPNKKTKVIEVSGKQYRLNKLDARSASYLAIKAASLFAPALFAGEEIPNQLDGIGTALNNIPRAEFDEIQNMLLATVYRLNDIDGQQVPEPVIKSNGEFVDSDMNYDVTAVITLTAQAFAFNVGSFFNVPGLMQAVKK